MKMLLWFLLFMNVFEHALAVVVEVNEGERSVLLLCLYSGFMPEDPTVMWTRNDLHPKSVHLRGEGGDNLRGQNQRYSGRTSMSPYALITKDFSLTLRKPTITDSGSYTCSISAGGQERRLRDIQLQVKDQQVEVKVKEGSKSVTLPCKTNSDLPEDTRVEWTRSDLGLMMIHEYSNKSGQLVTQDDFYRDRTHMNEDVLRTGDLSLTLKQPKERDTGRYICTIYRDKDILRQKVLLNVKEPFPSWAIALLVLLVLLVVSGGLLFYFRHCFMSVYKVEVDSGVESVQLPCKTIVHLHKDTKVEWKDRNNRNVYMYPSSSDQPDEQDTFYRGRMKMKRNLLKTGNLSLNLAYPTQRDTNTYTCTVYSREGKILITKNVLLHVRVPQVVKVNSGVDFVQLTCKNTVHLPEDAKVEWTCIYNRPIKVHVYQKNSDQHKVQDQIYRDRTEMKKDPLRTGDLSLTLKYPTDWDKNIYTCTVYSRVGHVLMRKQVELNVRVCQVEVQEGVESVQLPFKTTENLPEDIKVVWWDSSDRKVHVYQICSGLSVEQDWVYRHRTKMNKDPLKTGDLSLTLMCPTERDSREYRCKVYGKINRYKKVLLKIKAPQLVEVDSEVEFVQLLCKTTVHVPEDAKVEWTNGDKKVHVYQNGSNQLEEQNQCYRNRTKVGEDPLKTGDLSLTLQYPTDWDSNTYTCTVYSRERCILVEKQVKLKVRVCQVKMDPGVECTKLPFKTTENLPEDVVVIWMNGSSRTVLVYHSDHPEEQDQVYRGRTKMNEDLLRTGDLSLTLKLPTETDSGTYRCDVLKNDCIIRSKTVQLKIKETFQIQNETWDIGFRRGSIQYSIGFNFTCHSSNHGSSPDVSYGSSFVEQTLQMDYDEDMNYHGHLFQNDLENLDYTLAERGGGLRRESRGESSEEERFTLLNQWKATTK